MLKMTPTLLDLKLEYSAWMRPKRVNPRGDKKRSTEWRIYFKKQFLESFLDHFVLYCFSQLAPPNSKITITNPSLDMYGRTLAYVYGANKAESLSERMIKEGLAIWYKWQAGCEAFESMEIAARNNNLGFWPDYKSGIFLLPNEYKRLQNSV